MGKVGCPISAPARKVRTNSCSSKRARRVRSGGASLRGLAPEAETEWHPAQRSVASCRPEDGAGGRLAQAAVSAGISRSDSGNFIVAVLGDAAAKIAGRRACALREINPRRAKSAYPGSMTGARSHACIVAAALLLVLAAASAGVAQQPPPIDQSGNPAAGLRIAESHCAGCHSIGVRGASRDPRAPPFRELSRNYPLNALEEAFAEGILVGHRSMPEFMMRPDQIADLLAYLQRIQTRRGG